jgi:hypothetical protein
MHPVVLIHVYVICVYRCVLTDLVKQFTHSSLNFMFQIRERMIKDSEWNDSKHSVNLTSSDSQFPCEYNLDLLLFFPTLIPQLLLP